MLELVAAYMGVADAEAEMRQGRGGSTLNNYNLSLGEKDFKGIKQSVSEAIRENNKDFYVSIDNSQSISGSKIESFGIEYKRYDTVQELEADGLTDIAEAVKRTGYFDEDSDPHVASVKGRTLQNIRITIYTASGREIRYDSLEIAKTNEKLGHLGIEAVTLNQRYLRLDSLYINRELNEYITNLFEKRENITYNIWNHIVTDVLEELYARKYGWYMIFKWYGGDGETEYCNHESHTLYVMDNRETKIIKITDLVQEHFDMGRGKPSDRYNCNTAEYALKNYIYINRDMTIYTDDIKENYPDLPIIEISYKTDILKLRALREEQR